MGFKILEYLTQAIIVDLRLSLISSRYAHNSNKNDVLFSTHFSGKSAKNRGGFNPFLTLYFVSLPDLQLL